MKYKKKPRNHCGSEVFHLAAGEGFEPSHTESESAVLPLHKPAISVRRSEQILFYRYSFFCQGDFSNSFRLFSSLPAAEQIFEKTALFPLVMTAAGQAVHRFLSVPIVLLRRFLVQF